MTKALIHQEGIPIVNIHVPNIGSPKYRKQKLTELKGEINDNIIIVGDSNILFSIMSRSSRLRINKETVTGLTDIYRTSYPTTTEYTFLPSIHATFSMIDHILGQKQVLENSGLKSYHISTLTILA